MRKGGVLVDRLPGRVTSVVAADTEQIGDGVKGEVVGKPVGKVDLIGSSRFRNSSERL